MNSDNSKFFYILLNIMYVVALVFTLVVTTHGLMKPLTILIFTAVPVFVVTAVGLLGMAGMFRLAFLNGLAPLISPALIFGPKILTVVACLIFMASVCYFCAVVIKEA